MRVAVVAPETIHHRDADDTRRLQRLVRGLHARDHEVTVCCARWWEGESPDPSAGTEGVDGRAASDGGAGAATPDDAASSTDTAGTPDTGAADAPSASDHSAVADPDELPPAGKSAAGTATEHAPGEVELGPGADENRGGADAASTVTVDGITYRAVVADPTEHRGFATRVPLSIRRASPDVIHAVARPPSVVVGARLGATLARAPLLAEWYDPAAVEPSNWSTKQAIARPRRIVTPSRLTRRQLLELGADDAKLQVIPNAIDMERIRSTEPTADADVVYARRLDEDANLESLFLGLAELRDRGWSATIVGDGPVRREYEQQARELRIDDRVTFAGACDRAERVSIYRGAHAFVQTARRCVFPTELCWALACGCVGIVEYHADSSAHELVEGQERGFRTTNPQETAQAIRDAGDLEPLTIDENYERYDEPTVLGQYEECYEALREGHGLF